jgi:uncharacterized protein YraI
MHRALVVASVGVVLAGSASLAQQQAVASSGLNVRKGRSTSFEIVGHIDDGDTVTLLAKKAKQGYFHVQTKDSIKGWAWAARLHVVVAATPGPVTPSAPTPGGIDPAWTRVPSNAASYHWQQLNWLRQRQVAFYNRVLRATAVFIESYYNAENVDIRARILLHASAFEILLDLPEQGQRKVFKERVEHLTRIDAEKRIRYSFEMYDKTQNKMVRHPETRTIKAMWAADRFYTLRNHIIHGNKVRASEYRFRGKQHHLAIAPRFFVQCIKQLIDELLSTKGRDQVFTDRLHWTVTRRAASLKDMTT